MIRDTVAGVALTLESAEGLFSPRAVDAGTKAMLSVCDFAPGMRVWDLGCGTGAVGIVAAKKCGEANVLMTDIDPLAVKTARENALRNGVRVRAIVSDGFRYIRETGFDLILTNPPYQSDFSVAKHFIEKGFNRLTVGGRMMMVTKRRTWYENKLKSVFGGCQVAEIEGYYVFTAQKRRAEYARMSKQTKRGE